MGEGVRVLPFNKCCGLVIEGGPSDTQSGNHCLEGKLLPQIFVICVPRTSSAAKPWALRHIEVRISSTIALCCIQSFASLVPLLRKCVFVVLVTFYCLCFFPVRKQELPADFKKILHKKVQCGCFNLLQWFLLTVLSNWNLIWMGAIWVLLPVSPENSLFSKIKLEIQNFCFIL